MCLTWLWHVRCTHTSMTKITAPSEDCSMWHTLSPIHILHSTVNVGSSNTFCRQKLDYCALSLFGGIPGTIVNCYLASASVNNTLPLSSVYQISPDIHYHLPGKSQSSTAGNNGAPTSVPLSLGHALYKYHSADLQVLSRPWRFWKHLMSYNGVPVMKYWAHLHAPTKIRDDRTPIARSDFSGDGTAVVCGLHAYTIQDCILLCTGTQ